MKESFLHFIWRYRRYDTSCLLTTTGEKITVLQPGNHNHDAGPDFSDARLRIGSVLWAGHVELHVQSSDWLTHRHQEDAAYRSVILHVVLEEDVPIYRNDGSRIPCLELKKRIPPKLLGTYQKIQHNQNWIPCQHQFHEVSLATKHLWLDRLLVERLEEKTAFLKVMLGQNQMDWEETFYQFIARHFGLKINVMPFESLARSLPQKVLALYKGDLLQVSALLFGQAGLLADEFEDHYPKSLQKAYLLLQKKHGLTAIDPVMWKFHRLHPANFPTIRLAQFAALIHRSTHLFRQVLEADGIKELIPLFDVRAEGYWSTHYTFKKASKPRQKTFGTEAIRLLIINAIVPFLFLYGENLNRQAFKDKALRLLEELKPERNKLIKGWEKLGMSPESAYQTQALLQLKNEYCDKKRCLSCGIGGAFLK